MNHQVIHILDFGSQYTQLIARRLRELGVRTVVERGDCPADEIRKKGSIAVVLSGGPSSVFEPGALQVDVEVFNLGIPVLGVCYGMQLMARYLGGEVEPSENREYGHANLEVIEGISVLKGTPDQQSVWMSHGDHVGREPEGFTVAARTANTATHIIPSRRRPGS